MACNIRHPYMPAPIRSTTEKIMNGVALRNYRGVCKVVSIIRPQRDFPEQAPLQAAILAICVKGADGYI